MAGPFIQLDTECIEHQYIMPATAAGSCQHSYAGTFSFFFVFKMLFKAGLVMYEEQDVDCWKTIIIIFATNILLCFILLL